MSGPSPSSNVPEPAPHTGRNRDRTLRRAGRLRRTLVGGSVAASLAIAGLAGTGALASPSSTSAGHAVTGSSSTTGSSTGSSTKSTSGTSLSSGSGMSHATTSGS